MNLEEIVKAQRAFFRTGATMNAAFRKESLQKLYNGIIAAEKEILEALRKDLNKSEFEGYMTEVGMVRDECRYAIRHVRSWSRPTRVRTPLAQFAASSYVIKEPYGAVLVMSPWNYPFMLTLAPVIGAIAAGNCVVIKPSAYSPATSQAIANLIGRIFPPEHVTVVQGGRKENAALLDIQFDYILFTGSTSVGRLVMEKAARFLTPISLELGGKSPAIIDETADIPLAATRLAWGKFLNAGQTCVAPDYVLIHESRKEQFISSLTDAIQKSFPNGALQDPDYVHIINEKQFDRLAALMKDGKTRFGGESESEIRCIAPTILDEITFDSPVMQEEIFGPILPILTYSNLDDAIKFLRAKPKPLALYLFTSDKTNRDKVLGSLSFGGGCVNDAIIHLATSEMGFGGVGDSGMGSYHGKKSFDTFTHEKSIVDKKTWLDLPMRYRPYSKFNFKLLRMFLK
jgi:aldehyde dehydrogenase (NAD+)